MGSSRIDGSDRTNELQSTPSTPFASLGTQDSSMRAPSATGAPSGDEGSTPPSTGAPSLKKLSIGGFLPLPTIEASPVCAQTAAPFVSFREAPLPAIEAIPTRDRTPPRSRMALRVLFPTPTWISTPPTPPRYVRKQPLYDPNQPSNSVSPSTSFPASTVLYVTPARPTRIVRRSRSCPAFESRDGAISRPTPTLKASLPQSADTTGGKRTHGRKRSKTVFHIPSDTEDSPTDERTPSSVGHGFSTSPDEPGHKVDTKESNKDVVRLFYALQELLVTEVDYVRDLRVLFTAYIQQLPLFEVRVSTFSRTPYLIGPAGPPWIGLAGQTSQYVTSTDGVVSSPSPSSAKPFFFESEVKRLARNLEDILQLHEVFLSALRKILSALGISGTPGGDQLLRCDPESISSLVSALKSISELFTSEAPKFAIYTEFCAGHSEALDLLRKATSQHPSEWDSFEQRCSTAASGISSHGGSSVPAWAPSFLVDALTDSDPEPRRRRTISTLSPKIKKSNRFIEETDHTFESRQSKLTFSDYLIKPTQRICRYPLLLEQLKPKKSLLGSGDVGRAVTGAIKAMQGVAASVDEASHKREVSTRSSLIVSRLVFPQTLSNSQSIKSLYSPLYSLTSSFVSSLGDCLLAGSLDVLYYSPLRSFRDISSVKAKYLGAFLYQGGYLILAKIIKGKRYEPQHWFSLANFFVDGDGNDQVMLPYSIRLSSEDVHFELAAACQKEKDIWLKAIEDALRNKPNWSSPPSPSYKNSRIHSGDPRAYTLSPTSTIHTSPGGSDTESSEQSFQIDSPYRKLTLRKSDAATLQDQSRSSSRYSSTTSIKSIFSPVGHDPNAIYINRSLLSGRLQVEHDLEDVASRACLEARNQAVLQEQVLFPPPPGHYRETWGFSRSNSAISVANLAKSKLSKRESLRVPRQKMRCDSMTAFTHSEPTITFSRRGNVKRFSTPLPRLSPMTPFEPPQLSSVITDSPTVGAQLLSNPSAVVPVPFPIGNDLLSRPSSPLLSGHRNSSSLIRNVRGLFRCDSSPTSPQSPPGSSDERTSRSSSLLRRWRNSVSRRRSRSVPHDEPETTR